MLKEKIEQAIKKVLEDEGYFVRVLFIFDESGTLEKPLIETSSKEMSAHLVIRALKTNKYKWIKN